MALRDNDWIERYLEYEEDSEPPQLYKEWVAVSTIAAVLQRKCKLPWGGNGPPTFYPNLYIVLVGPSGRCRKGTAMDTGKRFLRDLGIRLTAEAITREALIKDLAESTDAINFIDLKGRERTLMHSSLTVFSKELAVFLGYENKQLMSDLTDWYDCADKWEYRTKGSGIDEIVGVWLNIIGATTPEMIQSQFPEQAVGGGLTSRIIFVYQDKKSKRVSFPFMREEKEHLYDELLNELDSIQMLHGSFRWDEGLLERWDEWYGGGKVVNEVSDSIKFNDRFAGYIERRQNHLLKLCMILSVSSRDDMIITGKIFDRAHDLLRRTEKRMARTFSGYGRASHSATLQKMITYIAKEERVKRSKLYKHFYYDIESTVQLDELIRTLKTIGFCNVHMNGQSETTIVVKDKENFEEYF